MTGEFELSVFCCDTGGNLAGSRLKKEKRLSLPGKNPVIYVIELDNSFMLASVIQLYRSICQLPSH